MLASPAFELVTAHFPVVVTRTFRALSDAEHEDFYRAYEAVYARRERFVAITDLRQFGGAPTARQRQRLGLWYSETKPLLKKYSLGHAVVMTSPIMRGSMTALRWLVAAEVPEVYVANVDAALAFCVERLHLAGLDVGPNPLPRPSQMRRTAVGEAPETA